MPVNNNNNNNRLLKLPAELRLHIYSYALLVPKGVACQAVRMHCTPCFYRYTLFRTFGRRSRPSKDANAAGTRAIASKPIKAIPAVTHTRELNQLKHVCRDMYLDTKGLLVATNNLVFEYGIDKFLTFVRTCPSSTLKTLRNITIIECRPPTSRFPGHTGDYAALFECCKEYPKAEVQLRHDRLRPTSPNFFEHALGFNVHFRKNPGYVSNTHYSIPVQIEALNAAIESWGATSLDDIEAYPDNLRAYPPYGMSLEEFLEKLQYDANLIPGGDFSALLLAREIYENGI